MLEILIIFRLCSSLGDKLRKKGHNLVGYQVMLVSLWIGGEIFGAIVGVVVGELTAGGNEPSMLYIFALGGAAAGATITYLIANSVSDNSVSQYEEEPYFQPGIVNPRGGGHEGPPLQGPNDQYYTR